MRPFVIIGTCFFALQLSLSASAQFTQLESNISVCYCNTYGGQFYSLWDAKVSIGGGIGATYKLGNNAVLMGQLQYARNGAKGSLELRDQNNDVIGSGNVYLRVNTLTLPVMAGISFGSKLKFVLAGGGYVGMVMNAKVIDKSKSHFFSGDFGTRLIDMGLAANVSAYIPVSEKFSLRVGLQENYGLKNLNKYNGVDAALKLKATNLQIGWVMKLQ